MFSPVPITLKQQSGGQVNYYVHALANKSVTSLTMYDII